MSKKRKVQLIFLEFNIEQNPEILWKSDDKTANLHKFIIYMANRTKLARAEARHGQLALTPPAQLPAADYELQQDSGPSHMRNFVVRARLGQHERLGASNTKKQARQLAAEGLYHYLRENLKLTRDFVEASSARPATRFFFNQLSRTRVCRSYLITIRFY